MAYLRFYSIIPISILLIELGWVSWKRFKKSKNTSSNASLRNRNKALKYTAQIAISNVCVLNSYAFGQMNENVVEDEKSIDRFLVQSTLTAFTHHSFILVIIMVIAFIQPPDFFISTLIVEPGSEDFYLMIGGLMGIGLLSLTINLCYFKWKTESRNSNRSVYQLEFLDSIQGDIFE